MYLDACPRCARSRNNQPLSVRRLGASVRCQYRCRACLHSWWTSYATQSA